MTVYVFPGQGSQKKGMGGALFDVFRDITENADDILGYSIKELCLHDPSGRLNQTQFTQPALYVANALMYLKHLADTGEKPTHLAGHSLGEYNALFAAGAFDFETGLRLVTRRGEIMAESVDGGMCAVLGAKLEAIEAVFADNQLASIDVAALNAPDQLVISGPKAELAKFTRLITHESTVRCVPLNVGGPFHSRYMAGARKKFETFLNTVHFSEMTIPVVANATAEIFGKNSVRSLLSRQITDPVRWTETVFYFLVQNETEFKEIGPGRRLSHLIESIRRSTTIPRVPEYQSGQNARDFHPVPPGGSVGEQETRNRDVAVELPSEAASEPARRSREKNRSDDHGADIAIIGMACRFPGAANTHQFWRNLDRGINSIKEITPDRWDIRRYYSPDIHEPNKSISKWCGLVDHIDQFDNGFFNISPREAKNMDPQQRLLLEETWRCIEDSGVCIAELQNKQTAVYVGVIDTDYRQAASMPGYVTDSYAVAGNYDAMLANRISYIFGLTGASICVEAACASSLVALNGAKRALLIGEAEYAIAGGVNLNLHPWKYFSLTKARMLSPDGQCKAFDAGANGYVPGDGVGLLLLQRKREAIAAGNHIYGVIRGSAVNHGGRTQSFTAPRVESQRDVILQALDEGGVNPETVTYIEAHGTGTSLGDPIEVEALTRAYRRHTERSNYCKIGSVKTNIGHLEAAAGMAGVIKVLLMMKHRTIPKTLNVKSINPIISFENSPFSLALANETWAAGSKDAPLRAGVSSFGMGGVNSHVLLEEYREAEAMPDTRHGQLFVLSAKTESSLSKQLVKWKSFVDTDEFASMKFRDICWTVLTGRRAFGWRYGVFAKNKDDLKRAILSSVENDATVHDKEKFYCLRLGELRLKGYRDVAPLVQHETAFSQSLARIQNELCNFEKECTSFERLNQVRELISGFKSHDWPKASTAVYAFMVKYAYARALIEVGVAPGLIAGEGDGVLAGLAASGALRPIDGLALLTGQKSGEDIVLRRPTLPFYDNDNHRTIAPIDISRDYVRLIRETMRVAPEIKKYYIEKGRLLFDGQFTFKRFMQDWDLVLNKRGLSVDALLHKMDPPEEDEERGGGAMAMLLVLVISSLRKLRLKWDLTQQKPIVNELFSEVVDLVVDGVMGREELAHLLLDSTPDYQVVATALCENAHRIDRVKPYHYLRTQNRGINEIPDVSDWLARVMIAEAKLPQIDDMVCVDLGEIGTQPLANDHIVLDTSGNLDQSFKEFLLSLWLHGVHMDWHKIFASGRFKKVSLPGYAYDRKSHWLQHETIDVDDRPADASSVEPESKITGIEEDSMKRLESEIEERSGMARVDLPVNERRYSGGDRIVDVRVGQVQAFLVSLMETLLEATPGELDPKGHLSEYGVDSILIHHFNAEMEKYSDSIPQTLLMDHSTIEEIAEFLTRHHGAELADLVESEKGSPPTPVERVRQMEKPAAPLGDDVQYEVSIACDAPPVDRTDGEGDDQKIAIIGLAGIYPGAQTMDELWNLLVNGEDCITQEPVRRNGGSGLDECGEADRDAQLGGFLKDAEYFDPLFFGLSPAEASLVDPQERLFLEVAYRALEDAGYTRHAIAQAANGRLMANAGVFVGVSNATYQQNGGNAGDTDDAELPVSFPWSIANRASYFFNFNGPSIPVDTGCASSLTAVHMACESIRNNECAYAIAGGVNIYSHPSRYALLRQMNMLSPSGKCHSFGCNGDGFVPGEGVGAILLKPYAAAKRDHDNIYAVIKSTSINHGGRSNGYMVPNASAQATLVASAIDRANVPAESISYIEAQGIGSPLSDTAEIAGLKKAFKPLTQQKQFCSIGTIKTNIGHTEAAAGIAGLTKVLLQMKHQTLVPSLNSAELNPNIEFEDSPFFVQRTLEKWRPIMTAPNAAESRKVLRAGVSAFGAGGGNAHLIVESNWLPADEPAVLDHHRAPHVIVLSARSDRVLVQSIRNLVAWINSKIADTTQPLSMENLAYTLQVGREPMAERLAVVTDSLDDLAKKLNAVDKNPGSTSDIEGVFRRSAVAPRADAIQTLVTGPLGDAFIDLLVMHRDMEKLALVWADGADIPWQALYNGRSVRKISLPTYPFERRRYWIDGAAATVDEVESRHDASATQCAMQSETHETIATQHPTRDTVQATVVQWVTEILKLDPHTLHIENTLRDVGFNSLAGTRLANRIHEGYGVRLAPAEIFKSQNIKILSERILHRTLSTELLNEKPSASISTTGEPLARDQTTLAIDYFSVDDLSDGEVDRLVALIKKNLSSDGNNGTQRVSPGSRNTHNRLSA